MVTIGHGELSHTAANRDPSGSAMSRKGFAGENARSRLP